MSWPKHYSLKKDHEKTFELHDKRDDKSFHVLKKDLHPANQIKIMKMQKFASGGVADDSFDFSGEPEDETRGTWGRMAEQEAKGGRESADLFKESPDVAKRKESKSKKSEDERQTLGLGPSAQTPPESPPPVPEEPPIDSGISPEVQAIGNREIQQQQQAPASQMQPTASGPAQSGGMPSSQEVNQLQNQQVAGIQGEARGQMAQNDAVYKAQALHQNQMQLQLEQMQATNKHYQDRADQLAQEIATGKEDPKRYWNSLNDHGKARTWLAAALGGLGSGMAGGGTNQGLAAYQRHVDQDIAAQRNDLGRKQSLLNDNMKVWGNVRDAETATRLQMNAIQQGELAKIAAQTNNPIIAARAQQQIAIVKQQGIPLRQQMAQADMKKQMVQQLSGPQMRGEDPSLYVKHMVPEHHQNKVFEEIKAAQDIKALAPKILAAFDKGSSKNPNEAIQGAREFEGLINTTVTEQEGTARQAAFDSIHKNMNPSWLTTPGANAAKRRTVQEYLAAKAAAPVAKGHGIDLGKFKSTAPMEIGSGKYREGEMASDAKGNRIVFTNNGWAPYHGK